METQNTRFSISFAEKVRIFSQDYLKCCIYVSTYDAYRYPFTKKLYSTMISSSQVLEDLLDFHGAKNNSVWYFYRELSAAIRHLSLGSYHQRHLANRLVYYDLADKEDFKVEGEATLDFLTQTLIKIAPVVLDEAVRLNIQMPKERFVPADFPVVTTIEMLEVDIDDEDRDQQKKNIVKIASEFLNIAETFDEMGFYEPYDIKQILKIVPEKINEVKIRQFEMLLHNLQSSFDTYVIHGGYLPGDNKKFRKLKQLRSYFSTVFHILQVTGRLLHFFERHLHEAGYKNIYKQVQKRLANLVDPEILLDRTINYGLYYACHFLAESKKISREIMNENIERSAIVVNIPQKLGFHSRPSLMVAKVVQHYGGKVELCVGSDRFDASSVLDIQWAGGKIQKENITRVTFEGDIRALKDIEILASVNYGEDTIGKNVSLPNELKYLR